MSKPVTPQRHKVRPARAPAGFAAGALRAGRFSTSERPLSVKSVTPPRVDYAASNVTDSELCKWSIALAKEMLEHALRIVNETPTHTHLKGQADNPTSAKRPLRLFRKVDGADALFELPDAATSFALADHIEARYNMQPSYLPQSWGNFVQTSRIFEQTPIRNLDPVQERLRQRGALAVLNGTEWLTSAEVDALVPGTAKRSNAHARAHRLLGDGRVFAIEHGGHKRYPRYAFDALGTPYPAVREVLQLFGKAPALRVASWFESATALLDGHRPRELLDSDPDAVVQAARAHIEGPLHG